MDLLKNNYVGSQIKSGMTLGNWDDIFVRKVVDQNHAEKEIEKTHPYFKNRTYFAVTINDLRDYSKKVVLRIVDNSVTRGFVGVLDFEILRFETNRTGCRLRNADLRVLQKL